MRFDHSAGQVNQNGGRGDQSQGGKGGGDASAPYWRGGNDSDGGNGRHGQHTSRELTPRIGRRNEDDGQVEPQHDQDYRVMGFPGVVGQWAPIRKNFPHKCRYSADWLGQLRHTENASLRHLGGQQHMLTR